MKLFRLRPTDPEWAGTADFANRCNWVAGPQLSKKMREGDFQNWERVFMAEWKAF